MPEEPPVVAELGRPETPDEKAARIAEARRRRRSNQTAKNLALSIAASLGIVLFLVLVVVRPDPAPLVIDHLAAAGEAEQSLGETVAAPIVPPTWVANRAELAGSGGVDEWTIGFITADDTFIGLVQGFDANPTWLRDTLRNAGDGDEIDIAGLTWQRFDRRGVDGVGLREYALVTETGSSTIVLYGTAVDADFALLATAVAADLPATID
ncbi:DUF4245 domain-containing protein [Microcella sp.]|uniref:DUF4245 domain-containing protein n=1 Tax=Microcella sp. TaxID=1913979 RepID=UPI0025696CC7|nr:DUF4245 domain-containing protein [Microcella sp.]MBX9471435.1 DUF4245 domain-containing protein [Microcella sp.]